MNTENDSKTTKKKIIIIVAAILFVIAALVCIFFYRSQIRATTMRILRMEGEVSLEDDGKKKTATENLRLNSGNALSTAVKSLVSIGLDDSKIVTLDELSRAEFNQAGRQLDLELTDGSLFFEVQKPLADEETLDIRTSTMVVGIRGTSGWVSVEGANESLIVCDGHVHVTGRNPTTDETKEIDVYAGQKVSTYLYNDRNVDSIMFYVEEVTEHDLPEFLLERLRENPPLLEKVCKETGWDKPWILGIEVTTPTPSPTPVEVSDEGSGDDSEDEVTPTQTPTPTKTPVPERTEEEPEQDDLEKLLEQLLAMITPTPTPTPVWVEETVAEPEQNDDDDDDDDSSSSSTTTATPTATPTAAPTTGPAQNTGSPNAVTTAQANLTNVAGGTRIYDSNNNQLGTINTSNNVPRMAYYLSNTTVGLPFTVTDTNNAQNTLKVDSLSQIDWGYSASGTQNNPTNVGDKLVFELKDAQGIVIATATKERTANGYNFSIEHNGTTTDFQDNQSNFEAYITQNKL